ncbi:MAG: hypothetical protein OER22_02165 [Gammaproteobacteria bacterium]|nr:hypothetical protein [Gammaproteobacteria bacterium]MDH3373053.1 hypothetical protein [Gammaproteobacteria bacterium]MDH3408932.1 hypothetical protein [Gammaproteobacteria bacterium]MDH3551399.1 hypothetical protein [Gammaproteobacteria bacterium]
MKKLVTSLISSAALAILIVPMTFAQTPDGATPANEGVCDVLQADGTTKGLYGLCIAFCEAQDHASISVPTTEEALAALADEKPAGRILANYNKKKLESDPPMPCIVVEEPCPCWSSEELNSIDGFLYDGSTADLSCADSATLTFVSEQRGETPFELTLGLTFDTGDGGLCRFENKGNHPATESDTFRRLFVSNSEITLEQREACTESIRAQQLTLGLTCN